MKKYIVWNKDKTSAFVTIDRQLAYEVRKGDTSNCYRRDGSPDHVAMEFCKLYSENEDCTVEESHNQFSQ